MASSNQHKKGKTPAPRALPQKEQKNRKTKKILITVVIVVLALALVGGTLAILFNQGILGNKEEYQRLAAERKTVATCNGFEIPYEELRFVTKLYKDSLAYSYGEDIWDDPATAEPYREELEKLVMENLNENYLILSTCRYLSIDTESNLMEEYVDEKMEDMLANDYGGDRKQMLEDFEKDGLTEHYMRFLIGIEYLHSTIYYTLLDAGLYDYTTDNISEFMDYVATSEDYARTIHVYIKNDADDDVAANRENAERISAALQAETDSEARLEMMHDYIGSAVNEDTQLTSTNGYYFTYGEMEESYEAATFALAHGEVSDVVETYDGFYVIMRLEPEMAYIMLNAQTLLSYYQSASMGAYIERFEEDCQVVLNEYGQSLDLLNLE